MKTDVIEIDAVHPHPAALARAGDVLRRGGLVAFPTETVYGLGANALDEAAVARIFAAKGRPPNNPLIVHVTGIEQAKRLAASWAEPAQRLGERFWPGPLSLIVAKQSVVPDLVTAGGQTVAVRVPSHAVAIGLIEAAGVPVAAPSANRSSGISPTRAEHVLQSLGGRIELVLDGGPTPGGLESTVIDLTVTPPRLLRPGLVTPNEIEATIGTIAVGLPAGTGSGEAAATTLRSPGMMERHYAPTTPLACRNNAWPHVNELCRQGLRVGWLTLSSPPREVPGGLFVLEMPADAAGYGAALYAALHTLDAMRLDRIVVELPPQGDAWLAVHDRLRRAAARHPTSAHLPDSPATDIIHNQPR